MRAPLPALLLSLAIAVGLGGAARALEEAPEPPHQQWPFEGVFGTYDTAASQRGFQVYKEVCSVCHAVKHLAFRNLEEIGYTEQQVKMAPPLSQTDQLKYADGTQATVPQMSHDVVSFLSWAAEPNLNERHRIGFKVILFLIIATGVFYAAKRKIWSRIH